jgi:hypothetical protein
MMKKFFTLIAAVMTTVFANAVTTGTLSPDDTFTIAGVSTLTGENWNEKSTANEMKANGDGSYTWTKENLTLDANEKYEFKIVQNHDWNNLNYGDPNNLNGNGEPQNASVQVAAPGIYTVKITFTPTENAVEAQYPNIETTKTGEATITHTYVVAGNSTALFTETWNGGYEGNKMTLCEDENSENYLLYVLEKKNVTLAESNIEYQVVMDNSSWIPGSNIVLNISEAASYDVVFTFDPTSKAVNATATKVGAAGEITHKYVVAGDPIICGVSWDGSAAANEMTKGEDGKYTLTFKNITVDAATETQGIKVVLDGGTWYGNGDDNIPVVFDAAGTYDVTVTFDPETSVVTATVTASTTGIGSVATVKVDTKAPIFNLAGQRVNKDYKGVVIQNGRKFIQK